MARPTYLRLVHSTSAPVLPPPAPPGGHLELIADACDLVARAASTLRDGLRLASAYVVRRG